MTIGRRPHPGDAPLPEGGVDFLQIDNQRRVVLPPANPRETGRATIPIVGNLSLAAGETKELLNASWEGADGAIAANELPPFLSWCVQVKVGNAQLRSSLAATMGFDIPAAPGAFGESEGASVARWFAKEPTGTTGATIQIIATVLA